jgi:hypothetical protein
MSKMITKLLAVSALLVATAVSAQAAKIAAYYTAPYASAKTVKAKLGKAGFKVLATYSPASNKSQHVIIFTNKKLTALASKKSRGFAAIQRVLVDDAAKTVMATNPSYWLAAFMQKENNPAVATSVKSSMSKALGQLTATKDVLDADDLPGYHFMIGMPYYKEMIELKAGGKTNPKKKIFELQLNNGSKLVGVTMGKTTEKFVDKIGVEKSILLPYTILVEDGKGYALHPKYYIALSYPLLSMGQFMGISSIPSVIERKLKKIFR